MTQFAMYAALLHRDEMLQAAQKFVNVLGEAHPHLEERLRVAYDEGRDVVLNLYLRPGRYLDAVHALEINAQGLPELLVEMEPVETEDGNDATQVTVPSDPGFELITSGIRCFR